MIQHVVMFSFKPGTTEDQVADMVRGLAELSSYVPEIRSLRFGADVKLLEGNFDFGVVAEFDDPEGYFAYRDHPKHQSMIKEQLHPIMLDRARIQFEY